MSSNATFGRSPKLLNAGVTASNRRARMLLRKVSRDLKLQMNVIIRDFIPVTRPHLCSLFFVRTTHHLQHSNSAGPARRERTDQMFHPKHAASRPHRKYTPSLLQRRPVSLQRNVQHPQTMAFMDLWHLNKRFHV